MAEACLAEPDAGDSGISAPPTPAGWQPLPFSWWLLAGTAFDGFVAMR
jgi:hypothetical protein